MQSLAPMGQSETSSFTKMSTAFSLSILNENETELNISLKESQPIEFFIPRDANTPIPPRNLINVTSKSVDDFFDYSFIDLEKLIPNKNLTISLHLEIEPVDLTLAYLFVYQFDKKPDPHHQNFSSVFCPQSKKKIFLRN